MTRKLINFLRPAVKGNVFFDVGANVGSYTLSLAKDAKQVYSFEASARNFKTLENFVKCAGCSNVEGINRAVSERSGEEIRLFTSPDTVGNYSQFHDFGKGFETATTVTLDKFVQEKHVNRVDVIKIDIEGRECGDFRVAQRILQRDHPLLLVEFNALMTGSADWKLSTLNDLFLTCDYKSYELRRGCLPCGSAFLFQPDFHLRTFLTIP